MAALKDGATIFVDYFSDTQTTDKMGLISFSTAATLDRPMGYNFVSPMKTAIAKMVANDYTNAEDAIDKSDGPGGFTNQTGVPADARVKQFAIFFSDGRPARECVMERAHQVTEWRPSLGRGDAQRYGFGVRRRFLCGTGA